MDARQKQYLDAMGITVWQRRDSVDELLHENVEALLDDVIPEAPTTGFPGESVASLDWAGLEDRVKACQLCDLSELRTQTVFGVGDRQADLMLVGEAPGVEEDRQGEPFVGQAGQLLNAMLQSIGIKRQQVYIANVLKCHPPENHDPSKDEAEKCQDYLFRQIELVQPKLILVLGRVAAHRLLNTDTALAELRGRLHTDPRSGTPMLITYHPAYLLRSPKKKREAWQDLLEVKKTLHNMVNT